MNALRHMRESLHRSQYEMAAYLGIPQPTYASYETRNGKVPAEIIEKVTLAYERDRAFMPTLPQILDRHITKQFPQGIASEVI